MSATPARHPFEIREHDDDGVHVIAVRGELDLATAPQLAVRIDRTRQNGARRVAVDLTTTDFCDSTGLRALLGAERELRVHGGRLAVAASPGGPVGRLFTIAGAHEVLGVHDTLEDAVAALR
jgi:anti-sigma B factor antagonist